MDKPLNIKEAAEYIGHTVSYMYQLVRLNKVPHHKPRRKLYFYASELDAWIKGETKNDK